MNITIRRSHIIVLIALFIFIISFFFALSGCSARPSQSEEDKSAIPPASDQAQDERQAILKLVGQGQVNKEMSYTLIMTGAGISSESKVWCEDNKMKIDSVLNGQRSITIFDLAEDEALTYLPSEKIATKFKLNEYQGQDNIRPIDYVQGLEQSDFEISGTEMVNKVECRVITLKSEGINFKQWINTQNGLPVKVEEVFNNEKITVEFRDIKLENIPDEIFDLPQDVEIMDINDLMQNRPEVS